MKKVVFIFIIVTLTSCFVKRVSRPPIMGYIYNSETLQKIDSVDVVTWDSAKKDYSIETSSDVNGSFFLKMKTYYDKMAIGGEAPMGFFKFSLIKKGYEKRSIERRGRYGFTKDTIRFDSIFLKPIEK